MSQIGATLKPVNTNAASYEFAKSVLSHRIQMGISRFTFDKEATGLCFSENIARTRHCKLTVHPSEFLDFFVAKC
jgi:hypothetical protein